MADTVTASEQEHDAHDHDHEHHENLAHHFDSYEQQFDAGKLGIWLFLVTEVLFFGGLFCAYALYRNLRPDVFIGSSEFLNTKLGAINTGVLLFSSLTMAWAVRCAQLRQHRMLVGMLAATLSCASMFLGVKAIEYSHKWAMGLLPAGLFSYDPSHPHHPDAPPYLLYICIPFALALVFTLVQWARSAFAGREFGTQIYKPLTVVFLCFFVGVGLGSILESGGSEGHASAAHGEHAHSDHAGEGDHGGEKSAAVAGAPAENEAMEAADAAGETADNGNALADKDAGGDLTGLEVLAQDQSNLGARDALEALRRQQAVSGGQIVQSDVTEGPEEADTTAVATPKQAGVFFSIYYCMTGVHAIHILAGMGVLIWLLVRAVHAEFNEHYFGPVDFTGLYWHLVDLIWIYLFPLLYLIG